MEANLIDGSLGPQELLRWIVRHARLREDRAI